MCNQKVPSCLQASPSTSSSSPPPPAAQIDHADLSGIDPVTRRTKNASCRRRRFSEPLGHKVLMCRNTVLRSVCCFFPLSVHVQRPRLKQFELTDFENVVIGSWSACWISLVLWHQSRSITRAILLTLAFSVTKAAIREAFLDTSKATSNMSNPEVGGTTCKLGAKGATCGQAATSFSFAASPTSSHHRTNASLSRCWRTQEMARP